MSANTHREPLSVAFVGQSDRRKPWLAPAALLTLVTSLALTAEAQAPKVAVLDIRATVGSAPPDFGVTAARLVAGALTGTGKYEVIDYDVVRAELAKRELRPPFGVGHLQLLADALRADLVVHGSVRSLTFDTQQRSASVVLSLEIVDGPSGNLKKRAEATGSVQATAEPDPHAIMVAALTDAVTRAVEASTGLKVQAMPAKVTVPAPDEVPGMAASPGEPSAARGAPPALLPAMEAGESVPRITTPAADLRPGAPPAPEPRISVVVVPRPQTGGGGGDVGPSARAETVGGTSPAPGKVTVLPEPPEEEILVDETADESLPPLITVKILAKTAADRALVTLGKGAAVTPKMELEVYRVTVSRDETTTRRKLGRIRITKINPTDAEARILEGAPLIATGDYAYYYGE